MCVGKGACDAVPLGVQLVPDLFPHPAPMSSAVDKNKGAAFFRGLHIESPRSDKRLPARNAINQLIVCAVPAAAEKVFDMPRELAKQISHLTGIQDLTPHVVLNDKVKSAKDCALEDKWATWEEANIEFDHSLIAGKRVLLVDDKYQSGLTMHFVAAKFLEAGAAEVHGIAMVKTLRDTDNLNVVES